MKRRSVRVTALIISACVALALGAPAIRGAAKPLPERLSDGDFWKLVTDFSEANGYFRSDNLLSNEIGFPHVITGLLRNASPGRVYLGVGPEQNFNYIAALKPRMAFIIDIRRGNLQLQLMYKALFELSADRADFVSRLFSKKEPDGLTRRSGVDEIFAAYAKVETSDALYDENLAAIYAHLAERRHVPLSPEDREGIEYVYKAFRTFGPQIRYGSSQGGGGGFQPSYADLMLSADDNGQMRSFLASEENFTVVKELQRKNLLVPVVGNFAGPKAIRSVGAYLSEHDTKVSAFYLSNVEQFLGGIYEQFCGNVATLPIDAGSTFIRSVRGGRGVPQYGGLNLETGAMLPEVKACASAAR